MTEPEPIYQIIADETTAACITLSPLARFVRDTHSPKETIIFCAELLGIPADELRAIVNRKEARQE